MPRCVRNFWVELEVDGKKERVATGPKSSGGGFTLEVKMRNEGSVEDEVLVVVGRKDSFGNLVLTADVAGKSETFRGPGQKVTVTTHRRP